MRIGSKLDKYIGLFIYNPMKTYNLVKHYFKRPKMSVYFFTKPDHYTYSEIGKIIEIRSTDVDWKDKWYSPRFEDCPRIWVCFFRRFGFCIEWHAYYKDEFGDTLNGDIYYWEYVLNIAYYKKRLTSYSTWTRDSKLYKYIYKGEDKDVTKPYINVIPCVSMSLNKNGIKELKKLLEDGKYL